MSEMGKARRDYLRHMITNCTKAVEQDDDRLIWAVLVNIQHTIGSYLPKENTHETSKA